MKKLSLNLSALESSIRQVIARFPFVIAMACGCFLIGIKLIHVDDSFNSDIANLLMTLTLGFCAYISSTLIAEQKAWPRQRQFLVEMVILAALVIYFFLLPDFTEDNFLFAPFFRYWLWLVGCLFLICAAPFLGRTADVLKTWEFNHQAFRSLVRTIFYGICLFVGLAIAFWAIDTLLFSVADEVYPDTWLSVVTIFGPLFFLHGIPTKAHNLTVPKEYPKEAKVFSQFILLPLVTIYFTILYMYSLKILITWEWPEGMISWMIIWFSFLGVLTYFFLYPLFDKKPWAKNFSRIFWWALIPQVGMLFYAVSIRISNYGITENRYLVVCFGAYLLGLALYFLFSKAKRLLVIPTCLSIIVVLSSFGPWGALSVSERSQLSRLEGLLVKNGMYQDGLVKPATINVSDEDAREIMEATKYLYERHPSKKFHDFFGNISVDMEGHFYEFRADLTKELNIKNVLERGGRVSNHFYFSQKHDQRPVIALDNKYEYLIEVRGWNQERTTNFDTDKKLILAKDKTGLIIRNQNQMLISVNLKEKISEKLAAINWDRGEFEKNPLEILAENDQVAVKLIIRHLGVERKHQAVDQINSLEAITLIAVKN